MKIGICNKGNWTTSVHTLVVIRRQDFYKFYHKQVDSIMEGREPPLPLSSYCELVEYSSGVSRFTLMETRPICK